MKVEGPTTSADSFHPSPAHGHLCSCLGQKQVP
uniref:Uncharacterized protein n=1 Tax=Chlorocebus sabaeus TaxID=60711 RepID=A0A0D9RRC8_CHLSB